MPTSNTRPASPWGNLTRGSARLTTASLSFLAGVAHTSGADRPSRTAVRAPGGAAGAMREVASRSRAQCLAHESPHWTGRPRQPGALAAAGFSRHGLWANGGSAVPRGWSDAQADRGVQ